MGCCDNENPRTERELPEGIEPCCSVKGRKCLCLPYDDPWIITAQILTIVSVFFAWIWWATFFINLAFMALFQILWCTRMRSGPLYSHVAVAVLSFVGNMIVGIYVFVNWKKKSYCYVWDWWVSDDDWRDDDFYKYPNNGHEDCKQIAWGSVALVCAVLWAAAAICMFVFVKSGRHAKWEKKHTPADSVELAVASTPGTETNGAVVADAAVLETEKEDTV